MIPPRPPGEHEVVIEAHGLTQRFGSFVAVDHVSFRIERGEIYGFLGANGCGKSTTMKMLCGLLPPTEGQAWLFGEPVDANDIAVRRKVGYMSQAFSLYSELTVRQNLVLHAQLFDVPKDEIPERVEETAARFGLDEIMDALPDSLPLGQRQRLQLAVALIHRPALLILDEPTSGVDPVARDGFWEHLIELSRRDKVTIFVSTHFINEARRCDRISLMSAGKVLVIDTPDGVVKGRHAATLEDAFIGYLEEAEAKSRAAEPAPAAASRAGRGGRGGAARRRPEPNQLLVQPPADVELQLPRVPRTDPRPDPPDDGRPGQRDPDDHHGLRHHPGRGTPELRRAGPRPDDRQPRLHDQHRRLEPLLHRAAAGRRLRGTRPAHAVGGAQHGHRDPPRLRPGRGALGRARGTKPVRIGVWIDGAMPQRAETIRGYVQGMHLLWLQNVARHRLGLRQQLGVGQRQLVAPATIELRYRYNPDVKSLAAMVPAVIPLLLLLDPGHAGDALGGPREGPRVDHQLLRHADDAPGVPAGQAAPLRGPGDAQLPAATAAGGDPLPRAAEGGFSDRGRRRAALRRLLHRDRAARLDLDAHPGGGAVRDGRAHPDPRRQFLRPDRPGFLPGGIRSSGRGRFTRPAYYITISRGTFNKALGFAGLYELVHPPADRHPGAGRAERGAS